MLKFAKIKVTEWSDLKKRLAAIGWRIELNKEGHYNCYPPNRELSGIVINPHNYEEHDKAVKRDVLRISSDLWFLFENPWGGVPENFDPMTLKPKTTPVTNIVTAPFNPAATQANDIIIPTIWELNRLNLVADYVVQIGNEWLRPVEVDLPNKVFMTADSRVHSLPLKNIKIRKITP